MQQNPGYFINGNSEGGVKGPLMKTGTSVDLVYGKPAFGGFALLNLVKPCERAFEILKYDDPSLQASVYITRHDPRDIVWGRDRNAQPVEATPELLKVFDYYLSQDRESRQLNVVEDFKAWQTALQKSGIDPDLGDKILLSGSEDKMERYFAEYFHPVAAYIEQIPDLRLTRVEGIDHILEKIEINSSKQLFSLTNNIIHSKPEFLQDYFSRSGCTEMLYRN